MPSPIAQAVFEVQYYRVEHDDPYREGLLEFKHRALVIRIQFPLGGDANQSEEFPVPVAPSFFTR
jgi:hypothetical protein